MAGDADHSADASWAFLAPVDLREHDLPSQAALGLHRGRTEELPLRAAAPIERLNHDLAEIREARQTLLTMPIPRRGGRVRISWGSGAHA